MPYNKSRVGRVLIFYECLKMLVVLLPSHEYTNCVSLSDTCSLFIETNCVRCIIYHHYLLSVKVEITRMSYKYL
jgi:hypothetical protein